MGGDDVTAGENRKLFSGHIHFMDRNVSSDVQFHQ